MTKKKAKSKWQESENINRDFSKIYIYKRKHILLMPIPYKWQLDVKKIAEFKNNK